MNATSKKEGLPVRTLVIWGGVIVVVVLVGYLFTAAPTHYAQATGTVADGSEQFEVGGGATVTPAEGWTVESKVDNIAGPFNSWSVLFSDTGTELRSPDRVLAVDITTVSDGAGDPVEAAGQGASAETISETLASGSEVRHVQTDDALVALIEGVGSEPVVLEARAAGGAELTEYRPAISALLESLR